MTSEDGGERSGRREDRAKRGQKVRTMTREDRVTKDSEERKQGDREDRGRKQ